MRLAISLALVLAAAGSRQGCGSRPPPEASPYDACAGKACGETCTICDPADRNCGEPTVLLACDLERRCGAKVDGICDPAKVDCLGKPTGAACVAAPACSYEVPACAIAVRPGACDASGTCVPTCAPPDPCPPVPSCAGQACGTRCLMPCSGTGCTPALGWCAGDECATVAPPCPSGPPTPSPGCAGKACGDPCGLCPPGTDPAHCPVPTFAATACDAALQCATAATVACSAEEACRGKACGVECVTCPACMRPAAMSCDATARCVDAQATCAP